MQELTEDASEIAKQVAFKFTSGLDVEVEDIGTGCAKVTGRQAFRVRELLDDTPFQIRSEINQHSFYVEWEV